MDKDEVEKRLNTIEFDLQLAEEHMQVAENTIKVGETELTAMGHWLKHIDKLKKERNELVDWLLLEDVEEEPKKPHLNEVMKALQEEIERVEHQISISGNRVVDTSMNTEKQKWTKYLKELKDKAADLALLGVPWEEEDDK